MPKINNRKLQKYPSPQKNQIKYKIKINDLINYHGYLFSDQKQFLFGFALGF